MIYHTLRKHIVVLGLLVVGIQAQRLAERVERRLVLLLRKEALAKITEHLSTLYIRQECVGSNLLIVGIRGLEVVGLVTLSLVCCSLIVGISTVVERLIFC